MGGPAYRVYTSLRQDIKDDYDLLKQELIDVFHNDDFVRNFRENLSARPRKINENIRVYHSEIQLLVNTAFPEYDEDQKTEEVYRRFLAGLDPVLRGKIREWDCHDVQDSIRVVTNLERAKKEYQKASLDNLLGLPTLNPTLPTASVAKVEIQDPAPKSNSDILLEKVLTELQRMNTKIDSDSSVQSAPDRSRERGRSYNSRYRSTSRSPSMGRNNDYRGRSHYRSQSRQQ